MSESRAHEKSTVKRFNADFKLNFLCIYGLRRELAQANRSETLLISSPIDSPRFSSNLYRAN